MQSSDKELCWDFSRKDKLIKSKTEFRLSVLNIDGHSVKEFHKTVRRASYAQVFRPCSHWTPSLEILDRLAVWSVSAVLRPIIFHGVYFESSIFKKSLLFQCSAGCM